jgi:hypothetical protein
MPTLYCRDCGNWPALFVPGAKGKCCAVCGGQLSQALPGIFVDYVPARSSAKVAGNNCAGPEPVPAPPVSEPPPDHFQFTADAPARRRRGAGPVAWGLVMSMTCLAVGVAVMAEWPKERSVASRARNVVSERPVVVTDNVAQATVKSAPQRPAALSRLAPEAFRESREVSRTPPPEPIAAEQPKPKRAGIAAGLREEAVGDLFEQPKPKPVAIAAALREQPAAGPLEKPEPPERKVAVACKDGTCASTKESPAPRGEYGTSLTFAENRYAAEKEAKDKGKLLFLLNISGNFEESKFT